MPRPPYLIFGNIEGKLDVLRFECTTPQRLSFQLVLCGTRTHCAAHVGTFFRKSPRPDLGERIAEAFRTR